MPSAQDSANILPNYQQPEILAHFSPPRVERPMHVETLPDFQSLQPRCIPTVAQETPSLRDTYD